MVGENTTPQQHQHSKGGRVLDRKSLMKAQKRGRVLYRAPQGTRYTPLLVVFLILSLALVGYHPVFIGLSILFFCIVTINFLFFSDKGFTVYEKGILIPISWYQNKLYERENIQYRRFVPFSRIEFFYPCSFKIYKNIIIPYGLTIKTPDFEYHLSHEYARVLSKKLRVAMRDDFDRLYKADYCIYRTSGDWKEVDERLSEYSSIIARTGVAFVILFIAIAITSIGFAHLSEFPFLTLDPVIQALIIIDSAIVSAMVVSKLKPGMLRDFYHATFRTWMAMERGEKVPEDINRSYKQAIKKKITREADVLEIFALDRRERKSRSLVINLVVLIQIMLIFSVTPPEFFYGYETDYSDSLREFPFEPLIIDGDVRYNNTELFANEIVTGDHSVTILNSTVWALGGDLFDIGSNGSIHAENSSFMNPTFTQSFRSVGTRNADHIMTRNVDIPAGSRLEFYSRYSMDYGFDFGYVSISSDGENWTRLEGDHTTDSRNRNADVGYKNSHAFTGTSDWIHESISLDGYVGAMRIQFHHLTDNHRYENDGEWLLNDIRIVGKDGSEILTRDGWNIYGWGSTSVTPNDFTMIVHGDAEFVNCSFQSNSESYYGTPILTILGTDASFTNCTFIKESGSVILAAQSSIELTDVFLTAEEDFLISDTMITIRDSEIHSEDIMSNFIDSYLIVENSTFLQHGYEIDPLSISTPGDSGILTWKEIAVTIETLNPNGSYAPNASVVLEPLHGGRTISGISDQNGFFSSPLFSGYEFSGTSTPREFFDSHLLLKADMYKITVENTSYYRFIGSDMSFSLTTGDAPDLTPGLSSFSYEYQDDGNETNISVSIDIMNKGLTDTENVTLDWTYRTSLGGQIRSMNHTVSSIPAGGSMSLDVIVPESDYLIMEIDPNSSILEMDEGNNRLYIQLESTREHAELYAYGDHVINDFNTNASLLTYGDLVCMDGELDFSNEGVSSPYMTSYGNLYLENMTNIGSGTHTLDIKPQMNSYISNCDLDETNVELLRHSIIHDTTLWHLTPQSVSYLSLTNSTVDRFTSSGSPPFIRVGNCTVGSMSVRSDNALIHDSTFVADGSTPGITQYAGMLQLEDNSFTGYRTGFHFTGGDARVRGNTFEDCTLAVSIDQDDSIPLIKDILEWNTFTNCEGRLGYYHTITLMVESQNGRSLYSELQMLVQRGEIEDAQFQVTIQNESGLIFDQTQTSYSSLRPKLLQYVVAGNGSYEYPEYYLTVQKVAYGYHYSTFSNITILLTVIVEQEGDGVVTDIQFEPIDGTGIRLNVSVSSIGLSITDLEIAIFRDQTEIATHTFPEVTSDDPSFMHHTMTIEGGTFDITARIVSDDPFPGNNELTRGIRMFASDQTVNAGSTDRTYIITDGANVEVVDGTLDLIQEDDNQNQILVLEGGSLVLRDVTVRSDHPYVIRNYGELSIQDSTLIKPVMVYATYLEDGIYQLDSQQVKVSNRDPFELRLDSGVFNHGTLTMEDSFIEDGRIFSNGSLTMTNTIMAGLNLPSGHPDYPAFEEHPYPAIFGKGDITIRGCNISYYHRNLYLYQAEFVIEDSVFQYSSQQTANLSIGENWANADGGMLFLRTQGSIAGSEFHGIGVDIRNSTVDAQHNLFTSDLYYSEFQLIMRNSGGTYSENHHTFNRTNIFYRETPVIIFQNCSDLVVHGNHLVGMSMGVAMTSYFASPTVTNNTFDNFSYALRSHGTEIDHTSNTMVRISHADYSQWYELNLVPDDGAYHPIDRVNIYLLTIENNNTRVGTFSDQVGDALYYNDYLEERSSYYSRYRLLAWLEGYTVTEGNITEDPGYDFRVSMGSYDHSDAVQAFIVMDDNKVKRVVLPLPDLGVSMKVVPKGLTVDQNEELLFTVYNNGSKEARYVWVDITIRSPGQYRLDDREWNLEFLDKNSSIDLSHSWKVETTEFTVTYDIRYYSDEATSTNNHYLINLTAKEPVKKDTTRNTTYRGLSLFFAILALLFLGSVYIKKASKERIDAQGINFDVDEFRRSLKAVGSATGIDPEAEGADEELEPDESWDEELVDDEEAEERVDLTSRPPPPPPPPFAVRVKVPGKDICPSCHSELHGSDDRGVIICSSCGWMRYEKRIRPVVSPDLEDN